jgi:hypothetical protein
MTDKVRKTFLLMLSATSPGEIVAARDALVRLAQTKKYDVHSLARALDLNKSRAPGAEKPTTREMATHCWEEFDSGNATLSEKEQKFVREMMHWRKPTEKQVEWLESIYERIEQAGNV